MSHSGNQVFIVDDDESVCRALKFLLKTYSFEVDTFLSAEYFFKAVPDSAPGCLILDIHMPGMDGWQALRKIVKSGARRPVIIISAARNSGQDKQALRNHAAGFLEKPVNDRDLLDMLRKVCGKRKA